MSDDYVDGGVIGSSHHQPEEGELFVGLDGTEYEWRKGHLVRLGQGFEVGVEGAGDDVGIDISVTNLMEQTLGRAIDELAEDRRRLGQTLRKVAELIEDCDDVDVTSAYCVAVMVLGIVFPGDPMGEHGHYDVPMADGTNPTGDQQ